MSEEKQQTIAEELSAARQAHGLSLEEVQQQTGISLAVLQSIEAGQFDVVEPVFVRLAIKAYAELLGLDPEPLLTRFDQKHGRAFQPRHRPTVLASQPVSRRSYKPLLVIGLIIGVCCALAVAYYFFGSKILASSQAPAQATATPTQPTTPMQATSPTQSQPTTAPNDLHVAQSSIEPGAADTSVTAVAAQITEPTPVVLELEARDSTWVQIRWDDAAENFEAVIPSGERRRFEAHNHFVVLSTNPHGLRYWLNGQLLGDGQLGDPNQVLRFRATADGIELLGLESQPLTEEAPDIQP